MKPLLVLVLLACSVSGQVYSPSVLLERQPDATNLKNFASAIIENAGAKTPHQRAEAVWRFFLTDGRFVEPGFWYHIAGWAYEEPVGEVLDPMKLLNSYGFGLCYHIAPLLESVFEAAGFADARVWFLTGHTVAEVYYDGSYHYFDSDMMGYNVAGDGSFEGKPVASVRQMEDHPAILLDKLAGPKAVKHGTVDTPWYPADVRAGAIRTLSLLFTSTDDNYLFPFTRYSSGHSMDYVLRPGEKLVRYFEPEAPGLRYLPYAFNGRTWVEFPREIAQYGIRTSDGPRSQKDQRTWATGRIEYTPHVISQNRELRFDMPSPWVIIDAQFKARVRIGTSEASISIDTSTDGKTWRPAGKITGPYDGEWTTEPLVLTRSANGRHTAVSGSYGYQVRITRTGGKLPVVSSLHLASRIQLNPRTLPALSPGENSLRYRSGEGIRRTALVTPLKNLESESLQLVSESGQELLCSSGTRPGESVVELDAEHGFDFGARFIEVRNGLVPDKLTAETRRSSIGDRRGAGSIEWAVSPSGPWNTAWKFPENTPDLTGESIDRVLRWPEAFVSVRDLPAGTKKVWVRLRTSGPCIDNVRKAVWTRADTPSGKVKISHAWLEDGTRRQHTEVLDAATREKSYRIRTSGSAENESVTFEMLR